MPRKPLRKPRPKVVDDDLAAQRQKALADMRDAIDRKQPKRWLAAKRRHDELARRWAVSEWDGETK